MPHASRERAAEQFARKIVVDQRHAAGKHVQHVPVGFGLGDQMDRTPCCRCLQVFEEPGRDRVVVQAGDEIRLDARRQQRLEHGLHGDDHRPPARSRRPQFLQQVHVLCQARARRDQNRRHPGVGVLQQVQMGGVVA